MCGIAGLLSNAAPGRPVDRAVLRRMTDAMAARGPDGGGIWLAPDARVGLGHRRLAIIDPSPAGAQPFVGDDGDLVVVFNGEIYNHRELRADLERQGARFRTATDTEVLLHLYRRDGAAMVNRLRGMYAFAIWDARHDSLFLARDPFGIKPLYIAEGPDGLAFASQVSALDRAGLGGRWNPAALAGFLVLGFVPEPFTWREDVQALPAGCCLTVDRHGRRSLSRHADLRATLLAARPRPPDPDVFAEALADSVRHHFVSDVPVGLFLSAGLDSATLLAHARAVAGPGVPTLTLAFQEFRTRPEDEAPVARVAADTYEARHDIAMVSMAEFQAMEPRVVAAMDQPSVDGVNTFLVSAAAAARGWKVALSGLGGDELLGGYPSFAQVPRLTRTLAPLARIPGFGAGLRSLAAPILGRRVSPKWAGLIEYAGSVPAAWLLRRAMFMPWELPSLLPPELAKEGLGRLDLMVRLRDTVAGVVDPYLQVMLLEMEWYMRSQLLRDADWAGMAHGVEIRTPLVDFALFETLAPFLVGPERLSKRHLADGVRPRLPALLRERPKTGFTVPLRRWTGDGTDGAGRDGRRAWARHLLARRWGSQVATMGDAPR